MLILRIEEGHIGTSCLESDGTETSEGCHEFGDWGYGNFRIYSVSGTLGIRNMYCLN